MADNKQIFENGPLRIEYNTSEEAIRLDFQGKSILRDPSDFLLPLLLDTVDDAEKSGKPIILDFRSLKYMNSSTFTPLVKALEKARVSSDDVNLSVLYAAGEKWQGVSFAALQVFCTSDGRISIEALG